MADLPTFWATDFWAAGFWADNFWAGGTPAPTPAPPAGGGRRIYDPDDQKVKTRRLDSRERAEIDRWFRERAEPRYVAPRPAAKLTKRIAPPAPLRVFDPPPVTKPQDRIVAAKQFMALDALESLLDRIEYKVPPRDLHREALRNAELLRVEMARLEAEFAADLERRQAAAAEMYERQRLADEEELMMVLLALHEADE